MTTKFLKLNSKRFFKKMFLFFLSWKPFFTSHYILSSYVKLFFVDAMHDNLPFLLIYKTQFQWSWEHCVTYKLKQNTFSNPPQLIFKFTLRKRACVYVCVRTHACASIYSFRIWCLLQHIQIKSMRQGQQKTRKVECLKKLTWAIPRVTVFGNRWVYDWV